RRGVARAMGTKVPTSKADSRQYGHAQSFRTSGSTFGTGDEPDTDARENKPTHLPDAGKARRKRSHDGRDAGAENCRYRRDQSHISAGQGAIEKDQRYAREHSCDKRPKQTDGA